MHHFDDWLVVRVAFLVESSIAVEYLRFVWEFFSFYNFVVMTCYWHVSFL